MSTTELQPWPETFDEAPGLGGARIVYSGVEIPARGATVPSRVVVSYRGEEALDPFAVHYLCKQTDGGVPTGRYYLHQGTYVKTAEEAAKEVRRRYNLAFNVTDRMPRPDAVVRAAIEQNTERVRQGEVG